MSSYWSSGWQLLQLTSVCFPSSGKSVSSWSKRTSCQPFSLWQSSQFSPRPPWCASSSLWQSIHWPPASRYFSSAIWQLVQASVACLCLSSKSVCVWSKLLALNCTMSASRPLCSVWQVLQSTVSALARRPWYPFCSEKSADTSSWHSRQSFRCGSSPSTSWQLLHSSSYSACPSITSPGINNFSKGFAQPASGKLSISNDRNNLIHI